MLVTLNLSGEVNIDMYNKVLETYVKIKSKRIPNCKHIDIYLNTDGGDVYQGLAIHDLIKLMGEIVTTRVIVCGQAMSSGIFILQAAQDRVATEYSYLMIHYGEISCNSQAESSHNKELVDIHTYMCEDRLTVNKRTIKSWYNGDHFFNAERALECGLIDEII